MSHFTEPSSIRFIVLVLALNRVLSFCILNKISVYIPTSHYLVKIFFVCSKLKRQLQRFLEKVASILFVIIKKNFKTS